MDEVYFQLHHDPQLLHCSLRGQNAISQPEPQPLQCHHGVLPAGFEKLVVMDRIKNIIEKVQHHSVSLSLFYIQKLFHMYW